MLWTKLTMITIAIITVQTKELCPIRFRTLLKVSGTWVDFSPDRARKGATSVRFLDISVIGITVTASAQSD